MFIKRRVYKSAEVPVALGGWRRDRVLACDAMISACRKEVGIERDSGLVSSVQCLAGGGGGVR